MQYLQDGDRTKPEDLFMSRKAAARAKTVHNLPVIKKMGEHSAKHQQLRRRTMAKSKMEKASVEWTPVLQAGCKFWQHSGTGECVMNPIVLKKATTTEEENEGLRNDASNEFPQAFQFLESSKSMSTPRKVELLNSLEKKEKTTNELDKNN